jgi:hypothetical protein
MARNARPTAAKRAKDRKATTGSDRTDGDPDIAHIKLGPQPPADWQVEDS